MGFTNLQFVVDRSDKELREGETDLNRPCRGTEIGRIEAKTTEEVVRED